MEARKLIEDYEEKKDRKTKFYEDFIESYKDKIKRCKTRAYACLFICLPLWILSNYLIDGFQSEAVGCVILIVCLLIHVRNQKYEMQIKKFQKLIIWHKALGLREKTEKWKKCQTKR